MLTDRTNYGDKPLTKYMRHGWAVRLSQIAAARAEVRDGVLTLTVAPPPFFFTCDEVEAFAAELGLVPYRTLVLGSEPGPVVSPRVPYFRDDFMRLGQSWAPAWVEAFRGRDVKRRIALAEKVADLLADPTRRDAVSALLKLASGKALVDGIEDLHRRAL